MFIFAELITTRAAKDLPMREVSSINYKLTKIIDII